MIREAKRNTFIENYNTATSTGARWQLIHNLGVTLKHKKSNNIDIVRFPLNVLNAEFLKHEPLPCTDLRLPTVESTFSFGKVSAKGIMYTVSAIKSRATGPDNIPPKCFKLLAKYIAEPIACIVNQSFKTAKFPTGLKNIVVMPIPKTS